MTEREQETLIHPVESARAADLHYVSDTHPGIQRKRAGKHFSYLGLDGRPIHDRVTLQRIKSLAIPPAWTDVWICPLHDGHIQATGRDAKGRKQYRYHPRWHSIRGETKYERMLAFGEALPAIRTQVAHDMQLRELPREKVLATVVCLLETTRIRVGNPEYARANKSFGLTTMRDQHVDIEGTQVRFRFRGKSGKQHIVKITDRQLARIVQHCRDIPGYELFQYLDENGERRTIDSGDVNEYLREITGQSFSAKDFRTWAGTVCAVTALQELEPFETQAQAKRNIVQAITSVSEQLGNTPAICRKSYIHPAVLDSYMEGMLHERLQHGPLDAIPLEGLRPEEEAVLNFLQNNRAHDV